MGVRVVEARCGWRTWIWAVKEVDIEGVKDMGMEEDVESGGGQCGRWR